MKNPPYEVNMAKIPDCDIHKYDRISPSSVPAVYDGKTTEGPWAYMCETCFTIHGVGLGMGKGQKLIQA